MTQRNQKEWNYKHGDIYRFRKDIFSFFVLISGSSFLELASRMNNSALFMLNKEIVCIKGNVSVVELQFEEYLFE